MIIIIKVHNAATIRAKYEVTPVAADVGLLGEVGLFGEGAGAGEATWGKTVIASLMLPSEQCVPIVHIYHLFPSASKVITSLPEVLKPSRSVGLKQLS